MIPEYMIQDQQNNVFYGEHNLELSEIIMLSVPEVTWKVSKRIIYTLGCRLAALESDNSNATLHSKKSRIFVLGSDMKLLQLQ